METYSLYPSIILGTPVDTFALLPYVDPSTLVCSIHTFFIDFRTDLTVNLILNESNLPLVKSTIAFDIALDTQTDVITTLCDEILREFCHDLHPDLINY